MYNKDNMIKLLNNKQLKIDKQHRLSSHEEGPLLFSLVYLILYYTIKHGKKNS